VVLASSSTYEDRGGEFVFVGAHSTCSASALPLLLRLCCCIAMSQSQSEAAIRRTGAVVALAAASALMAMGFPAIEARAHVVLALHAILLLGCAAVLLSPAHGAVADLARRATEAVRRTALGASARAPTGLLRWLGFAGIVLYAFYVASDVAARNEAAAEAASLDTVKDFLLFLMFLAGVWAVYLSMIRERGGPPPRPAAAAEEDPDYGEVNAMSLACVVVDSKVCNIHDLLLLILNLSRSAVLSVLLLLLNISL
jgi:hypothetical protein